MLTANPLIATRPRHPGRHTNLDILDAKTHSPRHTTS
jgi:hypothetical protein